MKWRSNTAATVSGSWLTSIWPGLGVPASEVPSTGDSGAAYLYNDIAANSFLSTDELRGVILTRPAAGTMVTDEYSRLTYTNGPEGTNVATYTGYVNGVPYGTYNINLTILQVETGTYSSAMNVSSSRVGSKNTDMGIVSSLSMNFSTPTYEVNYDGSGELTGSYISSMLLNSSVSNGVKEVYSGVSQTLESSNVLDGYKGIISSISTVLNTQNILYAEKHSGSSYYSVVSVKLTLAGLNAEIVPVTTIIQIPTSFSTKYIPMGGQTKLNIPQATDAVLELYPLLDGKPPANISAATYVIYNRAKTILLTKSFSQMNYLNGKLTISLSEIDTADLVGTLTHECVARTSDGVDFYPLTAKPISFTTTIARIQ